MEYIKKDDSTLIVKKTIEQKEETKEYTIDFLKGQELSILKSKNNFIEARNIELEEVRTLISEAEKLNIKTLLEKEKQTDLNLI